MVSMTVSRLPMAKEGVLTLGLTTLLIGTHMPCMNHFVRVERVTTSAHHIGCLLTSMVVTDATMKAMQIKSEIID